MAFREPVLDANIAPDREAEVCQRLQERHAQRRLGIGRPAAEVADDRHRQLLRARRERPPHRRPAEKGDEFAPLHYSITSSAATCRVSGTTMPSALAVLRLMTK